MVRIHPGQPNKQKRPIERSAFSVCLGVCPGAKRPDPTPCAAKVWAPTLPCHIPAPDGAPPCTPRGLFHQKEGGRPTPCPCWATKAADQRSALPPPPPAPMKHWRAHSDAAASPARAAPLRQPADLRGGHPLPETTKARPKPGFCVPPSGIPKDPTPGAMDQRLENWVARRALCRPTFLRSTSRASRVMKPALRSSDFRVSSYSTSARAMPRRIAPA